SNLFEMVQRLEAQGNKEGKEKWDDGSDYDDVTKISIRADPQGISYIRFDYIKSGQPIYGTFHGLTNPDEQLESVEGYYEPKSSVILGIQFKTNLRVSELIGYVQNGIKFSLAVEGKKIIGFHGSSESQLNSLGAYFTWISPANLVARGGKGGKEWSDGADHEGVTKVYVRGGSKGIQFIKFDYVKDGQQIYGSTHGVMGKGFTQPFEIDHLNKEYLVSVEGYYDDSKSGIIQGLQFKTNVKTSELMGEDTGKKFRLADNGKKIIGFHGYAEKNLNSLGAYFTTSHFTKVECQGGTFGDLWDDGTFEGVRKVYVHTNDAEHYVAGVRFLYDNGGKVETYEHGTNHGKEGEFEVDYPNEFITYVEGTLKTSGHSWVESLTFKTSKGRTSPTFGNGSGSKFLLESKGCALVGFHGRFTNRAIYSLGAYFLPLPPPPDAEKVEPIGGDRGAAWDDGGFDGITKIYIGHTEMGVSFVKFLYVKDYHVVVGDDHGSKTLMTVDKVLELQYPSEYITSVEGSYDDASESQVIRMLRFKTNMRTSRDFGQETTSSFILEKEGNKIVGFHGKISNLLHQIGVHVLPITD
ncbi:unnamed protein product, partial [Thlaspi arvense]